ncbi:hypothetical protein [Bradyrhizobium sp. CCBAU 45384]|uniref:hypothetical protein n=1 Tax=Bradyrhizobium sp. CCBAU 45384 TaxID=858428 RepID=UPI0023066F9C|nr:hypothetical protein [Bradyrhizobium sp. CCBAU 45384]
MMDRATIAAIVLCFLSGAAQPQNAPNAPQYQLGTTNNVNSSFLPSGTTTGTALNGNSQISIPVPGTNNYGFGQNASTSPTPHQPGSMGGVVGFGRTF